MSLTDAYVFDAVRTPFGKVGGALSGVRPDDMAAHVVRTLVDRAVGAGRELGASPVLVTFDPHPVRLFRPDTPPFRLTSLDQRERLFAAAGAGSVMNADVAHELGGQRGPERRRLA